MKYLVILFSLIAFDLNAQAGQRLKLRQLEQGAPGQVIVADSLGNPSWLNSGGLFGGEESLPIGTLMGITLDSTGSGSDFGLGVFPNWPFINFDESEYGFFISDYYSGSGITFGKAFMKIGYDFGEIYTPSYTIANRYSDLQMSDSDISLTSRDVGTFYTQRITPENIEFSNNLNSITLTLGNGSPEGVVAANIGSLYVNISGGTNTTLYIKTTNTGGNTGWTAK